MLRRSYKVSHESQLMNLNELIFCVFCPRHWDPIDCDQDSRVAITYLIFDLNAVLSRFPCNIGHDLILILLPMAIYAVYIGIMCLTDSSDPHLMAYGFAATNLMTFSLIMSWQLSFSEKSNRFNEVIELWNNDVRICATVFCLCVFFKYCFSGLTFLSRNNFKWSAKICPALLLQFVQPAAY